MLFENFCLLSFRFKFVNYLCILGVRKLVDGVVARAFFVSYSYSFCENVSRYQIQVFADIIVQKKKIYFKKSCLIKKILC